MVSISIAQSIYSCRSCSARHQWRASKGENIKRQRPSTTTCVGLTFSTNRIMHGEENGEIVNHLGVAACSKKGKTILKHAAVKMSLWSTHWNGFGERTLCSSKESLKWLAQLSCCDFQQTQFQTHPQKRSEFTTSLTWSQEVARNSSSMTWPIIMTQPRHYHDTSTRGMKVTSSHAAISTATD